MSALTSLNCVLISDVPVLLAPFEGGGAPGEPIRSRIRSLPPCTEPLAPELTSRKHDLGPVRRNRQRELRVATLGESLRRARAIGRLPIEIVALSRPCRTKNHTSAIRRPDRIAVYCRIEGETGERQARQIPDPNVLL